MSVHDIDIALETIVHFKMKQSRTNNVQIWNCLGSLSTPSQLLLKPQYNLYCHHSVCRDLISRNTSRYSSLYSKVSICTFKSRVNARVDIRCYILLEMEYGYFKSSLELCVHLLKSYSSTIKIYLIETFHSSLCKQHPF